MSDRISRLDTALARRYRIEKKLGEGGMASVYLAEDLKHARKVALKILKPELAAVLGVKRFLAEIKTTASLQHPHILPLFDSGEADGFLYYVMPFVEGESLREKLDREKQLGVDEAVRIARDVADALDYAHRKGIVHRDIKPANILLHDGRPVVADFGIALAINAAGGGRMTETGLSLGTPHYMSPEQASAERDLSPRSDLYSLGCVLYEMLAGHPPHTGPTAQSILVRVLTEDPRPLTDVRRSVPANVANAVMRAIEKLPADRFESARAFMDALEDPRFTPLSAWSKLLTWSVTYLAAAWVASGVLGELGPRWGIGDTVLRAMDVVLFAWGVPVTIILAWYHGEKGRQRPTWTEAGALGLVTVLAAVVLRSVWSGGGMPMPEPRVDKIGVAVLPFEHRSALDSDRWFTEAIQDQLITTLGGSDELLVPSRTAVRPYAVDTIPPREIGRQLGVAYLLEGAVQRGGGQVLVSVALVSASSGERVWADDFDRTYAAEGIFDVQREVASRVAEQVLGRLAPDQVVRFGGTPTTSTEAMELVLRASLLWDNLGIARLEEAESLYAEAAAIDPDYVEAWAQLARTRALLMNLPRRPEWAGPARVALARAEALDPDAPSVLTARGYVTYYLDRNYEAAAASLERAAALRPNDAQIRLILGALLHRMGRLSDGIAVIEEALAIEPRSGVLLDILVDAYEHIGDRDRSRQYLGRWLTVLPDDQQHYVHEGWYRLRDGDVEGLLRVRQSAVDAGYEEGVGRPPWYYTGDYEREFAYQLGLPGGATNRDRLFALGRLSALMGRDDLRRVYGDSLRIASESELAHVEGLDLGAWQWPISAPKAYLAVAFALLGRDEEMRATAREALDDFLPEDDVIDIRRVAVRLMYAYAIAEDWDAALDMAELVLSEAPSLGATTPKQLAIDPMLQPIRDTPRFRELFGR